jgi:hypothetical protein
MDCAFNIIFSLSFFFLLLIKGDVYPVEASDDFSLNQILDAHWGVLTDEDVRNLVPACNLFLLSPF